MHVLIVPSAYPTTSSPLAGIFFRDQGLALARAGVRVGAIYCERRSLKRLDPRELFRAPSAHDDGGISMLRTISWAVPKSMALTHRLWIGDMVKLGRRYADVYGAPTVIHAHSAYPGGKAAQHLAKALSVPYLITEHSTAFASGEISRAEAREVRSAFGDAAQIIAVSSALAKALLPFTTGVEPSVIPNVVDTQFFCPGPRRDSPSPHFLSVALLSQKKGIDLLLRAFALAFRNVPGTLSVAGDGEERSRLVSLTVELGISDRVRFLGLRTRAQVRDDIRSADFVVSTSRVETFGVTLIEALACGIPVIATRSGGPEDFVTAEVGILIEDCTVEGIAEALRAASESRAQWEHRASKIRDYCDSHFGEAAIAARLSALYERVQTTTTRRTEA